MLKIFETRPLSLAVSNTRLPIYSLSSPCLLPCFLLYLGFTYSVYYYNLPIYLWTLEFLLAITMLLLVAQCFELMLRRTVARLLAFLPFGIFLKLYTSCEYSVISKSPTPPPHSHHCQSRVVRWLPMPPTLQFTNIA
jgi:hypothetical protein